MHSAYVTTVRWGIYISRAGALEPTVQSNAYPCLTIRDSVLHSLALGPPGLFLSPLSPVWGRGHLGGVQLAFLISRCQELENDLAPQLWERSRQESHCMAVCGPQPRKQGTVRQGAGGGSFSHSHVPPTSRGRHQTKGNRHDFTGKRKNFHGRRN